MTMLIDSPVHARPLPGAAHCADHGADHGAANADTLGAPLLPADHRGWLLFAGGTRPAATDPVPEWILHWPCQIQVLTEIIGHLRDGEWSQQELLHVHAADEAADPDVDGPGAASVVVWLLDAVSAAELGWTSPRGDVTPAIDEQRRSMAELELLFNATMAEVPGTRFALGFDDAAVARRISATLAKLERAGETHGDTLTRMALRILHRWSLPVDPPVPLVDRFTATGE